MFNNTVKGDSNKIKAQKQFRVLFAFFQNIIVIKYKDGVAVFALPKAGLMADASVGGQKFSYDPYERSKWNFQK